MSKSKKKAKSTSEYKSSGFLIPAIAILETLVLVAVSSYAWYYISSNKKMSSAVVTVQADSGLEIDFKDAEKNDTFIDVWDYVNDDFAFEPASSTDGRQIFFPTSGSFGAEDTQGMVFREGTANDVNTKYISIDFTLTNTNPIPNVEGLTGDEREAALKANDMDVYLSNNSKFTLTDGTNSRNGKALRLAFYNNDGNTGKIKSNYASFASESLSSIQSQNNDTSTDPNRMTVYMYKESDWYDVKAYFFDNNTDGSQYYLTGYDPEKTYTYKDSSGNDQTFTNGMSISKNSGEMSSFPGYNCKWESQNVYSYSFSNPFKSVEVYDSDGNRFVAYSSSERLYDSLIFSKGYSGWGNQTRTKSLYNNDLAHSYIYSNADVTTGEKMSMRTIYFLKPGDWGNNSPLCRISMDLEANFYNYDGEGAEMTYVTTGIYKYTYPYFEEAGADQYQYVWFRSNDKVHSSDLGTTLDSGKLYYFPSSSAATAGGLGAGELCTTTYGESEIYFYNKLKWEQPYAYVNAFADVLGKYTYPISMVNLSGGLYYCIVPDIFLYDVMSTRTDSIGTSSIASSGLANNCRVYFGNEYVLWPDLPDQYSQPNTSDTEYLCRSLYVYTLSGSSSPYSLIPQDYEDDLNESENPYTVIAPGVSAGTQRSASPVYSINTETGKDVRVMPAFASAFDDFLMGTDNPVFTIPAQHTVNMSMIIWLEGTDSDCTGKMYAGNGIELYLEFSTTVSDGSIDNSLYTYHFIDKTEELWTANTEIITGNEITPVMQLYDVTADKGYMMYGKTPSSNSFSNGNKIAVWECKAPQTIRTEGHTVEFRRVNPYDEEKIWNRWQAGVLSDYDADAYDSNTRTVTFTAFSDGSPDHSIYNSGDFAGVPEKSCGGVWGIVDSDLLYVYDNRSNRNISDKMNNTYNDGVLSIRYEYTYPKSKDSSNQSKKTVIEYKSSVHYDDFYSFVVPKSIYTNTPSVKFLNYVVKSKTAINAAEQSANGGRIFLRQSWNAGAVQGRFFSLSNASNGNEYNHWGNDVVYYQITNACKSWFTGGFYQIKYTDASNNSFYDYIYPYNKSGSWLPFSGTITGELSNTFVSIVPSDRTYTTFQFQAVEKSNHYSVYAKENTVHSLTADSGKVIVNPVSESNDGRIVKVTSISGSNPGNMVYTTFTNGDWPEYVASSSFAELTN